MRCLRKVQVEIEFFGICVWVGFNLFLIGNGLKFLCICISLFFMDFDFFFVLVIEFFFIGIGVVIVKVVEFIYSVFFLVNVGVVIIVEIG